MSKVCKKCNTQYPLTDFYRRNGGKYYDSYDKKCRNRLNVRNSTKTKGITQLTEADKLTIRARISGGESTYRICKDYPISRSCLYQHLLKGTL